jgi:hypothetical protein
MLAVFGSTIDRSCVIADRANMAGRAVDMPAGYLPKCGVLDAAQCRGSAGWQDRPTIHRSVEPSQCRGGSDMTEDLAKAQQKRQRERTKKQGARALDHSNPERGGKDMSRKVEHDKLDMQHEAKAKEEFRKI